VQPIVKAAGSRLTGVTKGHPQSGRDDLGRNRSGGVVARSVRLVGHSAMSFGKFFRCLSSVA